MRMNIRFLSVLIMLTAGSLAALFPCHLCDAATGSPELLVGAEEDFKPYSFIDEKGQPAGFGVDLIRAVADVMDIPIRISPGTWDTVWNGLVAGKLDALPVVAKLPSRIPLVNFSLPHTETFDAFFVRKGTPLIKNVVGAKGREIIVLRSDAAHHALLEHNFQGRIIPVDTASEMFSLLTSGKHDALLYPKLLGVIHIKEHGITGLLAGPPIPDYKRVFSFAVKYGDHQLLEKLNQGLMIIKTNGEYDRIYEKWLSVDEPWHKYEKYFFPAIAVAVGVVMLAGFWLFMLQRLVRKRTMELQKANETLRSEISEREKIESQMLRTQRMESIGTLAAGIAHDFNNILTPIMLNTAAALMDSPQERPLRKYLESTLTSAKRAKDLVQQILTFSRKGGYELKTIKFQDIITEGLKLLRASIPSTIEIRKEIDICGPVLADSTQMYQVVTNICTNAYQAMREKGGTLEIALREVDVDAGFKRHNMNFKPGRYVRFTVKDTGYGMDEATMERIFDPFFTTKGTEGTGLGLSVVLGIVIGHGGDIDVQSQPGKGTTFHVYLPRTSEGEEQTVIKKGEAISQGKERLLFIDDEKDIALMAKEILERFGYEVTAKTDSLEAVEEFRANHGKYDLVVTDYSMPKMDGLELAREIKKIRTDIPIILTSGFNETIMSEKFKMAGIDFRIMKPYEITDLANIVRQVINEEGQ